MKTRVRVERMKERPNPCELHRLNECLVLTLKPVFIGPFLLPQVMASVKNLHT